MLFSRPIFEILEHREDHALIWTRAGEAEATDREGVLDLWGFLENLLDLLGDLHRVRERRALRRLENDEDVALILVRDEAGRHPLVGPVGQHEHSYEHERHNRAKPDEHSERRHESGGDTVD